ncbi:hypothetical protein D3C76_140170 [compost metagenome]
MTILFGQALYELTQQPGDHKADALALSLLENGHHELTAYVTLELGHLHVCWPW